MINSGGGTGDVGKPGAGMYLRPFDAVTKPMTRQDFFAFISNPDNLTARERDVMTKMFLLGCGGMFGTGAMVYWGTKFLPWHVFDRVLPFKRFVPVTRGIFACTAASIPFTLAQQWGLKQILTYDDEESELAFQTRRFLVTQRGSVAFFKTDVREIPRAELEAAGALGATPKNANMQMPDPKMGINAEYTLQQQQLTPIAQSGYKPPPM